MRRILAGFVGAIAGIFVLVGMMGLVGSWASAGAVAVISAVLFTVACYRSRWIRVDAEGCPPALCAVSLIAVVVALAQLSRLAIFVISPSLTGYSFVPSSRWEVHHSCTTAYFVAARAAASGGNVYSDSLYTAPDDPTQLRKPLKIDSFNIDVYEYPPPFLLLPRALLPLAPEFMDYRALWFGITGMSLLVGMLAVAPLLGPVAGSRALLLSPLVWAALPTFSLLQKGNVQGMVVAMSMVAMVLFRRRWWAAGGALLAFATLCKLFPGMLFVYLLAKWQWRALAWTCALAVAFVVLSVLAFGGEMYRSFFDHLPRLLSGEAFPAFRNPSAIAMNFSVPTFLFKLNLFGVDGIGFTVSKIVGGIYTVVVVFVTVLAARRARRDELEPLVWLGVLILATLRSPFIPQGYAAIPPLWLLTCIVAARDPTPRMLVAVLLTWTALNVYVPHDLGVDPRVMAILNLAPLVTTVVMAGLALRVGLPPATALAQSRRLRGGLARLRASAQAAVRSGSDG